jgi:cell division protease FtsH
MNDKIGPIKYGDFRSHVHIRFDAPPVHESSEATAREIDIEVKKLIDEAHERARKILTDNRHELEKLAQTLLEKETLSAKEVDILLGRAVADDEAEKPADGTETEVAETAEAEKAEVTAAETVEVSLETADKAE